MGRGTRNLLCWIWFGCLSISLSCLLPAVTSAAYLQACRTYVHSPDTPLTQSEVGTRRLASPGSGGRLPNRWATPYKHIAAPKSRTTEVCVGVQIAPLEEGPLRHPVRVVLLCALNGGVTDGVPWTVASLVRRVDGLPLIKQVVCSGCLGKPGLAWQVMTRESAQAGNRASKTEQYLQ